MNIEELIGKGVACIECGSVIFGSGELLKHVLTEGHRWYRSGDDVIIKINVDIFVHETIVAKEADAE